LTLEMVYENHCGGTGRLGPLLDRCFLNTPPARAMRNRREFIAKEIEQTVESRDEFVHVTSLAGGPARELFDLFAKIEDPRPVEVSLLDIDLQALAHVAERRDKARLQNRINLINANLVYLAMGWQRLDLKDQDLIYSLGLTDYFNDRFVVKLLDWVYHRLRS